MIRCTINLVQELGVQTIVEGVETEAQLHRLQALACDEVQGFLIGEPKPFDILRAYPQSVFGLPFLRPATAVS